MVGGIGWKVFVVFFSEVFYTMLIYTYYSYIFINMSKNKNGILEYVFLLEVGDHYTITSA